MIVTEQKILNISLGHLGVRAEYNAIKNSNAHDVELV